MRRLPLILGLALLFTPAALLGADSATPRPPVPEVAGLALGTVTVGKTTYHGVRAKSRDARSLVFTHRSGLASVRLRDLPADIQLRLGYDPATAPPDLPPPVAARPAAPAPVAPPPAGRTTNQLDALFQSYARPVELRPSQTLQPEFIRLGLAAKNQGRRPSCAIYSIVSALEYQNSVLTGGIEKLSEEYLLWATRHSLGLTGPAAVLLRDPETGELAQDTGFTLPSVIAALQTYGIPLHEDMRNQPGLAVDEVAAPSAALIERARARRQVFIAALPGREPAALAARLVQALNAGLPVPAGLRWPHERAIRGGVLSAQRPVPDAFHAVTFVGYECPTGRLEDTVFVFKNSYGPRWGQGGYGRATWGYLSQHLLDAYVLDVRTSP